MNKIKQLNVGVPVEWFNEIERIARKLSYEQDTTISYLDLIRMTLKKEFNLKDPDEIN